jgi:hypothetical protein
MLEVTINNQGSVAQGFQDFARYIRMGNERREIYKRWQRHEISLDEAEDLVYELQCRLRV